MLLLKKKVSKKNFPLIGHVVDLENNWPVSACINPLSYSCKSHKKRLMILKMPFLIMSSGLIQFIAFPCIPCLGYNNISWIINSYHYYSNTIKFCNTQL